MILIIPLSDFHIFAKLFRASKNRKFDMPNFTTDLNQMDNNLRSCHGPWGQRAKLSPSSAGVARGGRRRPRIIAIKPQRLQIIKATLPAKYTLNETLNFCTVRGTGSQIIDFIPLSGIYIFQTNHGHQKSLNLTCLIGRTNYKQIALSFVIK